MAAPEPIASGTLEKTPLPHLLIYLDQKKLSGTLALWPDPSEVEVKGQDRILLLKGCPIAGKLLEPGATLREGLLKLFQRSRAPYAFYEPNLLGDDRQSGRVDPLSLITESLRSSARDDVVAQVLERFGDTRLRMVAGIDLGRYDFAPEERALIELLRAEPCDAASLIVGSGLPETRGKRLVYLLAISKAVAPYTPTQQTAPEAPAEPSAVEQPKMSESVPPEAAAPPDGNPHGRLDRLQSIPPPPEDLSEELRQRWLRVVAKGRLVENQNYFEMLEIDKDAKSTEARTKFYQLAKDWHPDRLPPELAPVREHVQIIFSYMSEANATLGDEDSRMKYVQSVREGGGTPATDRLMQAILDTAMEYERVLVMARKHDYDGAIELMKKILAIVPDDAEYQAMYASLLMQKFPGSGQDAPLGKMLEAVDKALKLHERHEKANMLKGQILRRMGRNNDALEFFKKAAEINPRNVEAMREVRVATMRSTSMAPKPGTPKGKAKSKGKKQEEAGVAGLIGKFFKKS